MFEKKLNSRTISIPLGDLIQVVLMLLSLFLILFLSLTPKGVSALFLFICWPLVGLAAMPLVLALERYKAQKQTYPEHIADLKATSQEFDVSKYLHYDHEGILNQDLYEKTNLAGTFYGSRDFSLKSVVYR